MRQRLHTSIILYFAWWIVACGRIGVQETSNLGTDSENGNDTATERFSDAGLDDGGIPSDSGDISDSGDVSDSDTGLSPANECTEEYANALACIDFEQPLDLEEETGNGSVALTQNEAFSGQTSLVAVTESDLAYAAVELPLAPPTDGLKDGMLYFRAYFRIPENSLEGLVKLVGFDGHIDDDDRDDNTVDVNVMRNGVLSLYFHNTGLRYSSFAGVVPEGEWFCLFGSIELSNTNSTVAVGIDGETVLRVVESGLLPQTGITYADFGIGWTESGQYSAAVYVDNIVVDTSPVSCR